MPNQSNRDRIQKVLDLEAPIDRVWRAVTDHEEFGQWFQVALEAPFAVGEVSRGRITYPGYEYMEWYVTVQAMEPQRLFSFTWCPYTPEEGEETPVEPTTLVEFRLETNGSGTRLTVTESGFSALPQDARLEKAWRMNSQGWEEVAESIRAHLELDRDRIERVVHLKAPLDRVWKAITDHEEFGQWFRVALEGPFVVGEVSLGRITYPGYEHVRWSVTVQAMEPQRLFSFTGCPYTPEQGEDSPTEPTTLVEFRLEPDGDGTRLTLTESGFSGLPQDARLEKAWRLNSEGWDIQAENIRTHVDG